MTPARAARHAEAEERQPGPPERAAPPPHLYEPRPDLTADSRAWQALLELAFLLDGGAPEGLFGALHGVRCSGARLTLAVGDARPGAGYRMSAGDAYLGGAPAWRADRARWLVPRANVLTPMLRGLRVAPEDRPAPGDAFLADRQDGGGSNPCETRRSHS